MNNQHQTICGLVLAIVFALGLYLIVPKAQVAYTTYKEVQELTQAVNNLKNSINAEKIKQENHEKEQKISTKPIYKNEIEVSDRMSSFGVMFEDVIQSAKYNGLKLRSISYDENPASDPIQVTMSGEYNVCAITMQLVGSYMQFRSYFQDIYNYPYLVNLDKVNIKPYEKNKKILLADVVVTLYSTKTEAERAAYAAEQAAKEAEDQVQENTGVGVGSTGAPAVVAAP